MSETRKTLERIRDLLKKDPPDHRNALRLAKDLFLHGICAQEQDALRQATILLLERLVLPALSGTQERQARVGRLVRQIRTTHLFNQSTIEAELREIGSWMAGLQAARIPPEPEPSVPAAVVQEALIILGGKAVQEIFPPNKASDWQTMPTHLGVIIHQERRWREDWRREQLSLQALLAKTAQELADGLRLIGADTEDLPLLVDRLQGEEPMTDWVTLQETLLQAMQRFRARANAIRQRLQESQEAVERSRQLVRHADWALMETRDERLMDVFTGLPNRFGLLARLEQAKQETDEAGFALVVILLGEYPEIVRDLGRDRVNRLIGAIAGRMVSLMQPGDYLARFNDETFVLLCPKKREQEGVLLAEQWRDILDRTRFELSDARLTVRTHYGVACYERGDNTERLLGLAAMAAQEALAEGGTRVQTVPSRQKPAPPPSKRPFGRRG